MPKPTLGVIIKMHFTVHQCITMHFGKRLEKVQLYGQNLKEKFFNNKIWEIFWGGVIFWVEIFFNISFFNLFSPEFLPVNS